jgi:hypothetical protein
MLDGFRGLGGEVTMIVVLQVMSVLSIHGPAAREQYNPHEELAAERGSCLIQFFGAKYGTLSKEECPVFQRSRVLLVFQMNLSSIWGFNWMLPTLDQRATY